MNNKFRAPHCIRHPTGCKGSKGSNFSKRSWKNKIPFPGMQATEWSQCPDIWVTRWESRIEGTQVTTLGSEVPRRDNTGEFEAHVNCGKNEVIPRAVHSPTIGPYCSEKIYGSKSEAPTCTGWVLPTIHINQRERRRTRASRHYSRTMPRRTCQWSVHTRVHWTGGRSTTKIRSSLRQDWSFWSRNN
jgi:hypothetical protein